MVFQLQFRIWTWAQTLILLFFILLVGSSQSQADVSVRSQSLKEAQRLYRDGSYFNAARYAFAAQEEDPSLQSSGYAWATLGLLRAGFPNAASYFFIRTLQSKNREAIRMVLTHTNRLIEGVGSDLLRNDLVRWTRLEDYDANNRNGFLFALGKEALLADQPEKALGYLKSISPQSSLRWKVLHLQASAEAVLGKTEDSLEDFEKCAKADDEELSSQCRAGQARILYQLEKFEQADRTYDQIPKQSFLWPDILFEQAWNSFGMGEYNRTLGKLVSYKSPSLEFVFNPEIDLLRAQTYLALCLYSDANEELNRFNQKYGKIGIEVKEFVESQNSDLKAFYELGREALKQPLSTQKGIYPFVNRWVRNPYFTNLVWMESRIAQEFSRLRGLSKMSPRLQSSRNQSSSEGMGEGFPGFLEEVLRWRRKTVQFLGGAFIKNRMIDHHGDLIALFEKISFIKLEMIQREKDQLIYRRQKKENGSASEEISGTRIRGNILPIRRDDQYYWGFNGEFWNDELGDYVFGLESECQKNQK